MAVKIRAITGPHSLDDRESDGVYEDYYEDFKDENITEDEFIDKIKELDEDGVFDKYYGYTQGNLPRDAENVWLGTNAGIDRLSGCSGGSKWIGTENMYWTNTEKSEGSSKDSKGKEKSTITGHQKSMVKHGIKQLIIWGEGPNDYISYLDKNLFNGAARLESVYVFCPIESIGDYCFANCTSLHTVCFFGGVGRFERGAFMNSGVDPADENNKKGRGHIYFGHCLGMDTADTVLNLAVEFGGRDTPHWYNSKGVAESMNYAGKTNTTRPILIGDGAFAGCRLELNFLGLTNNEFEAFLDGGCNKNYFTWSKEADKQNFPLSETNKINKEFTYAFPFDCRTGYTDEDDVHKARVAFLKEFVTNGISFFRPLGFGWNASGGLNGSTGYGAFYNCGGLTNMAVGFRAVFSGKQGDADTVYSPLQPYAGLEDIQQKTGLNTTADLGVFQNSPITGVYVYGSPLDVEDSWLESGKSPAAAQKNLEILIPKQTFYNCNSLTKVVFNSEMYDTIGESAFAECDNLTTVQYICPENITQSVITTIKKKAFYNCKKLQNVLPLDGGATIPWHRAKTIGVYAFACSEAAVAEGDTKPPLNIPEYLTSISTTSFKNRTFYDNISIHTGLAITKDDSVNCLLEAIIIGSQDLQATTPPSHFMIDGLFLELANLSETSTLGELGKTTNINYNKIQSITFTPNSVAGSKTSIYGLYLPIALSKLTLKTAAIFKYPAFNKCTKLQAIYMETLSVLRDSYFSYQNDTTQAIPFKGKDEGKVYLGLLPGDEDANLLKDLDLNEIYGGAESLTDLTCSMNVFYNTSNLPFESITLHNSLHESCSPGYNAKGGSEKEIAKPYTKKIICNNICKDNTNINMQHLGYKHQTQEKTNKVTEIYFTKPNAEDPDFIKDRDIIEADFIIDCSNSQGFYWQDNKYPSIVAGTFLANVTGNSIATASKLIMPKDIRIIQRGALKNIALNLLELNEGKYNTWALSSLFEIQQENLEVSRYRFRLKDDPYTYYNNGAKNIVLAYQPNMDDETPDLQITFANSCVIDVIAHEAIDVGNTNNWQTKFCNLTCDWAGLSWKYPYTVASEKTQLKILFKDGKIPKNINTLTFTDGNVLKKVKAPDLTTCYIRTSNTYPVFDGINQIKNFIVKQLQTMDVKGPVYKTTDIALPFKIETLEFKYGLIPGFLSQQTINEQTGEKYWIEFCNLTNAASGACCIKIQTEAIDTSVRGERGMDNSLYDGSFTAISRFGKYSTLELGQNISNIYETWKGALQGLRNIKTHKSLANWATTINFGGPGNNPMSFCPYFWFYGEYDEQTTKSWLMNPEHFVRITGNSESGRYTMKQYAFVNNHFLNSVNVYRIGVFQQGCLENSRALRELYCYHFDDLDSSMNVGNVYTAGLARTIYGKYVNAKVTEDTYGTRSITTLTIEGEGE